MYKSGFCLKIFVIIILINMSSKKKCCHKKCFTIPSTQVDGIACKICESFSFCKCNCLSYMPPQVTTNIHYDRVKSHWKITESRLDGAIFKEKIVKEKPSIFKQLNAIGVPEDKECKCNVCELCLKMCMTIVVTPCRLKKKLHWTVKQTHILNLCEKPSLF